MAAPHVMIEDVQQAGQAAVVHVRGRQCDVAQRRDAKPAHIFGPMSNLDQTSILQRVAAASVEIVKTRIGEEGAALLVILVNQWPREIDSKVTSGASDAGGEEQRHAALRRLRQRCAVIVEYITV